MKHTLIWNAAYVLLSSIVATPATADAAPTVDLGYGRYQGYHDSKFGLNVFKGCAATARSFPLTL